MSDQQAYEAIREQIQSMETDEVRAPDMPVEVFVREALRLLDWAWDDREAILAAGMPGPLFEELPLQAAALRHAESLWANERFASEEAQQIWRQESTEAYELRDTLVHTYRFAFRSRPDLMQVVDEFAGGGSHADMLQDLKALVVAGRRNESLLTRINFDMADLMRCEILAEKLGATYAEAHSDRRSYRHAKLVRDKMYTLLKDSVDEVRAFGQYLFWRDNQRKVGYTSQYHRERNKAGSDRGAEGPAPHTDPDPTPEP